MELKLNIYKENEPGEIEKTYKTSTYNLMFGTMEDFIEIIEPEMLFSDNKFDAGAAVVKIVRGGMDQLKPLYMEVFPGLTEGELRRTKVSELVVVCKGILKHSLDEMKQAATGKNV